MSLHSPNDIAVYIYGFSNVRNSWEALPRNRLFISLETSDSILFGLSDPLGTGSGLLIQLKWIERIPRWQITAKCDRKSSTQRYRIVRSSTNTYLSVCTSYICLWMFDKSAQKRHDLFTLYVITYAIRNI